MHNTPIIGRDDIRDEDRCQEKNPALWRMFCDITGRPFEAPNYLWTEDDVVEFILAKVKDKESK